MFIVNFVTTVWLIYIYVSTFSNSGADDFNLFRMIIFCNFAMNVGGETCFANVDIHR